MSINKDIFIDQGSDYIDTLLMNNTDGTPVYIGGYVFSSQLRTSYYSANPVATMNVSVTDATNGIASIVLTANITSNIPAGTYVYDISMFDTANVTTRIVKGTAVVTPQATWSANVSPPLPF